jgi:hypothetical protein
MDRRGQFSAEDVKFIYHLFKNAAERVYEEATGYHQAGLVFALGLVHQLCQVPGFVEELNKKADINLFVQLEIMQRKAGDWKEYGPAIADYVFLILSALVEANPKHKKLPPRKTGEVPDLPRFVANCLQEHEREALPGLMRLLRIMLENPKAVTLALNDEAISQVMSELIDYSTQSELTDIALRFETIEFLELLCGRYPFVARGCIRNGAITLLMNMLENSELNRAQATRSVNFLISLVNSEAGAAQLLARHCCALPFNMFLNQLHESAEAVRLVQTLVERTFLSKSEEEQKNAEEEFEAARDQASRYLQDGLSMDQTEALQMLFQLRLDSMLPAFA